MKRYDPESRPVPAEWLALDESERIALVERHHQHIADDAPNARAHAVFHVIVENQLALEDQIEVRSALERLTGEGLSRHDAIHAVGSVLAGYLHDLAASKTARFDQATYDGKLRELTARKWRDG
jgi:hypothetical protein